MYDFKEFYEIGEELSQIDDEAHIRSAINRDYYALFGESRKYLVEVKGKTYLTTKKGIHTKVCNALRYSNNSTEKYIGDLLFYLIEIRGFADYDWKEKNLDYFEKVFPKLKEDVKKGLDSLNYLKHTNTRRDGIMDRNMKFEEEFSELNKFYKMRNPERIYEFINNNKGLIKLLNEAEPYLISKFPNGIFELQKHDDITGEGYHKLYVNIFVDEETFNNGFMDNIHEINGKLIPLEKELNLMMKFILMPGVEGY